MLSAKCSLRAWTRSEEVGECQGLFEESTEKEGASGFVMLLSVLYGILVPE